jgi:hypothetical protein
LLSFDVEKLALPPMSLPVPGRLLPLRKATVPVGVPVPPMLAKTTAVKVTFCPALMFFALLTSEMCVPPWL